MSKFKLRNLENERRRLQKQIAKIDKQIDKVKNTKVISEGYLELIVKEKLNIGNRTTDEVRANVKYERFGNEITCTLSLTDKFLDHETFVGKAICAEDDAFKEGVGICIAECRAIQKVYEYMAQKLG